jgi:hypothetical protein
MPFRDTHERDIHFDLHGHEFGAPTAEDYERMADEFMLGPMPIDARECFRPDSGSSEPCWAGSQHYLCPPGRRDRIGFPREESQEAAKCRKHGSKEGRLRPLGSSREVRMAPSVARESTLQRKLNSQLHGAAVRSILSVGPEIDNGNPGSVRCSLKKYVSNITDVDLRIARADTVGCILSKIC